MVSLETIDRTLRGILREVFDRDELEVTDATTAADVAGWDSFRHIEIVLAAEACFGVRFGTRELDTLRSVGDLKRLIASKLG